MAKKTLFKMSFFFLVFFLGAFFQNLNAQTIDLRCQAYKFSNPDYVGDCQIAEEFEFARVRYETCTENGLTCPPASATNPDNYVCVRRTENFIPPAGGAPITGPTPTPVVTYFCEELFDVTGTAQCGNPNCTAVNNQVCRNVNFVAYYGDRGTFTRDPQKVWDCIDYDSPLTLNMFGVNLGPADVAIAKLTRTGLSGFLLFIGIFAAWQFVTSLWKVNTARGVEDFEETQKTVRNAVIGIFFVIMGLVLVQLFSSLFGISGNIFEFSYVEQL